MKILKNYLSYYLKLMGKTKMAEKYGQASQKIQNELTKTKRVIFKDKKYTCEKCYKQFNENDFGFYRAKGKRRRKKNGGLLIHHINGRKWDDDLSNLLVLCKSCHSKLHNEIDKVHRHFKGKATIENYIAKILIDLGVDLKKPDFKETPLRVARMYNELFEGYRKESVEELKNIFNSKFPSNNNSMVIVKDLRMFSLCPHHLLPVEYKISIGYVPKGYVLGLSKLSRISELLAKRPILQETLTVEIAEILQKELKCSGVFVNNEGRHYCMIMRGVKQFDSKTNTSHITGIFKKAEVRNEFLNLIKI